MRMQARGIKALISILIVLIIAIVIIVFIFNLILLLLPVIIIILILSYFFRKINRVKKGQDSKEKSKEKNKNVIDAEYREFWITYQKLLLLGGFQKTKFFVNHSKL